MNRETRRKLGIKAAELPQQPTPRHMDEIQKIYAELCARAGAAQYRMFIAEKELSQLNQALESVNNEAAAREKLDSEVKKEV